MALPSKKNQLNGWVARVQKHLDWMGNNIQKTASKSVKSSEKQELNIIPFQPYGQRYRRKSKIASPLCRRNHEYLTFQSGFPLLSLLPVNCKSLTSQAQRIKCQTQ